jgi:hypothetical protein
MPDTKVNYAAWRGEIDKIIGADARERLGHTYSWLAAWKNEQLSPHEAIADALARMEAKVERLDPEEVTDALRAFLGGASWRVACGE